ncbi:hypothetical protein N0V95_006568 [Ascochyta clinopodiicola]|nr:hypothetical protein N0V95_006568 [Ascochyta clinopodiicola]
MPGPQRSVRDAITDLGNIPILRPAPQQATIAHVNDESEDSDETLAEPAPHLQGHFNLTTVPTQPVHPGAALAAASIPALRHSTGLPFRLAPPHRRVETSQDAEQSDDSERDSVQPAEPPMQTTNVTIPATPGRRGANADAAIDPSPERQPNQSTAPAGLRGGASHPQRNRVRSVGQDAPHAPSPLRQTQVHDPSEESSSDTDEEHPVIHLQGYFDYKSNTNKPYTYTFRQVFPDAPQTEPFRRISQPRFHTRSQSSNDTHTPAALVTPTSNAPNSSRSDDVFWTAPPPAPERPGDGRTAGRPRLQSSEMSNTSLAYSYYELPENRHSSGEHTMQNSMSRSQYDGAVASRRVSHGTYRSVRLSDAQALTDNVTRPPTPNISSFAPPIPGFVGQWGASPLPAEPYARTSSIGHRPAQAIHRATQADPSLGSQSNAVAAAVENRASPLDTLTAQYGWASQRLADQQSEPQRVHHAGRQSPAYYSAYSGPSPYGPPMAMADDPYTLGATAHAGQHPLSHTAPPISAQHVPMLDYPGPPNYHVPSLPRTTQAIRSGQRSSENAHVGSLVQDARVARNAQVREQVSAIEQMQNAAQPRQTRRPQAVPRQRHEPVSSSISPALPMIPPQHGPRHRAALSPGHGNVGRRSIRMDPRLQDQENSGEAETEMMRQEFEAVRMRYDAEQQGDVMDETPPRIGRLERHM